MHRLDRCIFNCTNNRYVVCSRLKIINSTFEFESIFSAVFRYDYRRGMNNLIVTLVGGIPTAMSTVMTVTLALGARQLSNQKAIVTHVSAIEELAGVSILCSDKTGTLTLNKLVIDRNNLKRYADVEPDEIIHCAAIASRTEHQDAM